MTVTTKAVTKTIAKKPRVEAKTRPHLNSLEEAKRQAPANAFEHELKLTAERIVEHKKAQKDKAHKKKIADFRRNALGDMAMAMRYGKVIGKHWMEVLAKIEEKEKETRKAIKKMRDAIVAEHFGKDEGEEKSGEAEGEEECVEA